MTTNIGTVFISWTKENGRSSDLAKALNVQLVNIYPSGNLLLRYLRSAVQTLHLIRSQSGDSALLLMLPPAPLAIVARLARGRSHIRNLYDLHTGFFYDPKWRWACKPMLRLMRGGVAIVTNENLARICRDLEVETLVLHDVLRPANSSAISSDSIVCPVSYSNDEPIEAILKAAASLPDTRWVLTGRAPREVKDAASSNVEFTGFLDDAAYDELLNNAGLVVALTNRRDTMQRAAYEALVRTVPIVTSDFQVLREFFEDSAVYVDPGAANLTSRISEAIASRETIRERSGLVLAKRMAEQQDALIRLNILVNRQTYITEEIH